MHITIDNKKYITLAEAAAKKGVARVSLKKQIERYKKMGRETSTFSAPKTMWIYEKSPLLLRKRNRIPENKIIS